MPVKGSELASLDFANLIGGPLNAIVEAQAKSAITTANFIREVGFDKDGRVRNVDFIYNRKGEDGADEEFALTLPFITLLPIPYVSVSYAEIVFNAKITSTTYNTSEENFATVADVSAGGNWWFASARLTSKTAYQKKSSSSDLEQRTFDMHVRVEARNVDMPAGTERVLTLLENSISEVNRKNLTSAQILIKSVSGTKITVAGRDAPIIKTGATIDIGAITYTVNAVGALTAGTVELTLDKTPPADCKDRSVRAVWGTQAIAPAPAPTSAKVSSVSNNDITLDTDATTLGWKTGTVLVVNSNAAIKMTIASVNAKIITVDDGTKTKNGDTLTK